LGAIAKPVMVDSKSTIYVLFYPDVWISSLVAKVAGPINNEQLACLKKGAVGRVRKFAMGRFGKFLSRRIDSISICKPTIEKCQPSCMVNF
jgi:hypothetical protein